MQDRSTNIGSDPYIQQELETLESLTDKNTSNRSELLRHVNTKFLKEDFLNLLERCISNCQTGNIEKITSTLYNIYSQGFQLGNIERSIEIDSAFSACLKLCTNLKNADLAIFPIFENSEGIQTAIKNYHAYKKELIGQEEERAQAALCSLTEIANKALVQMKIDRTPEEIIELFEAVNSPEKIRRELYAARFGIGIHLEEDLIANWEILENSLKNSDEFKKILKKKQIALAKLETTSPLSVEQLLFNYASPQEYTEILRLKNQIPQNLQSMAESTSISISDNFYELEKNIQSALLKILRERNLFAKSSLPLNRNYISALTSYFIAKERI